MQRLLACSSRAQRASGLRLPTFILLGSLAWLLAFGLVGWLVWQIAGPIFAVLLVAPVVAPAIYSLLFRRYQVYGIGQRPWFVELTRSSRGPERSVRCVAISDTHGQHRGLDVPPGDVLFHAGDFSMYGEASEVADFNEWLGTLPHRHKVVIAGNHDVTFDEEWCEIEGNRRFWRAGVGKEFEDPERVRKLLTSCTYVRDAEVEVEGIRVYGAPSQPPLMGLRWAFNEEDDGLRATFEKIPEGIDVLLTHSPPYGHGDRTLHGLRQGCKHLKAACERVRPPFHVFGHIHDGYGVTQERGTTYINASSCTSMYHPLHAPIVFDVVPRGG